MAIEGTGGIFVDGGAGSLHGEYPLKPSVPPSTGIAGLSKGKISDSGGDMGDERKGVIVSPYSYGGV